MRKRFLPVLLVLCMVLVMLPVAAAASTTGGTETGGTGTTTNTPKFELPEAADKTDESALSSDKKYINNTGEGVSEDTDPSGKTSYYSVTAWLKYAEDDLAKIDENGKVAGNMTLASAAAQLLGAKAANANSTAEAKTELTKLIETTEAKFTAIKKLDLTTKSDGTALTMTDLTPVQYFTGVEELIISGQKIQGVNPENNTTTAGLLDSHVFSALKNLTVFKADDCGLTNIDALATCTKLTTLDLSGNTALANVNALAKCTELTTLNISSTGVSNLNFLYVEGANGAATTSLSKLATLTATGLELKVFQNGSDTNSISGAMQLVEKTADFKATAKKWDFGDSIKLGASTSLTNQQRQLINNFIDGLGSKLTSNLTKQELDIRASLTSLSVTGDNITFTGFDSTKLEYDVNVPANTKTVTITATPANEYEISAVMFGDQTQQGGASALANIDVSEEKGVHVQIVVSKTDDPFDQLAYVIRFNKLGTPAVTVPAGTVTDGQATVNVDSVADDAITAAKTDTDKTAVFNVVNPDVEKEMTSAVVTIGAGKIKQAKDDSVSIEVDVIDRENTSTGTPTLKTVGTVKLSPTALDKIITKAGTSVSSAEVTIAVSKEKEVSSTIPNMDKYTLLGDFKVTVSVGGTAMTTADWGTLTTSDSSATTEKADILLTFPVTGLTNGDQFKVFLDGEALSSDKYYFNDTNNIVVVRAPHLSEVTIVKDRPTTTAKYTVAAESDSIGSKVTINGVASKYYIIQVGDSAPAAIFCLQAGSSNSTLEFYVSTNEASTLKIWQADNAISSFTDGVPSGDLAEVQKAE